MVKIQIDLTDDEDRLVEIFKAENRIDTKENSVKEIVKRSAKCKHKFEMVEKIRIGLPTSRSSQLNVTQRCIYCGEVKTDSI